MARTPEPNPQGPPPGSGQQAAWWEGHSASPRCCPLIASDRRLTVVQATPDVARAVPDPVPAVVAGGVLDPLELFAVAVALGPVDEVIKGRVELDADASSQRVVVSLEREVSDSVVGPDQREEVGELDFRGVGEEAEGHHAHRVGEDRGAVAEAPATLVAERPPEEPFDLVEQPPDRSRVGGHLAVQARDPLLHLECVGLGFGGSEVVAGTEHHEGRLLTEAKPVPSVLLGEVRSKGPRRDIAGRSDQVERHVLALDG